ncbi:MAG: response regulator [Candidatus Scalindua rubra]|uniref:Two-component response regulator n=1 Tax=Candidatus Scalindua brodae TaxID=237368 RepID=A0A0B0EL82_9BACT|nr:MAG: two-component response regulator [Candidatus Scalindua brodae]MBZ0109895.1 response regulator [Candidatus Scalindua rubra]
MSKILVVDDEVKMCELLKRFLEMKKHNVITANCGEEALKKVKVEKPDLILLDIKMPGMDGLEVARHIRRGAEYGDIPIIMVTALSSRDDRIRAVEVGANDFIAKPVDMTEVLVRTASLLKMKHAQDAVKSYQAGLELKIAERTADLQKSLNETVKAKQKIYEAYLDTLHRLTVAAEYKDEDTAEHIKRMSSYCTIIARSLHMPQEEIDLLYHVSAMHDIGKIGTPDSVLLKPGKLTPDEWTIMKQHTVFGAKILDNSPSELLQLGKVIAITHHEKWDGSGYPSGLAGEDIPLWGRICAVSDVFDALTSERPYKKAFSNKDALSIMKEGRGNHFEPQLIDLFM